jgi:hypothetical protein
LQLFLISEKEFSAPNPQWTFRRSSSSLWRCAAADGKSTEQDRALSIQPKSDTALSCGAVFSMFVLFFAKGEFPLQELRKLCFSCFLTDEFQWRVRSQLFS